MAAYAAAPVVLDRDEMAKRGVRFVDLAGVVDVARWFPTARAVSPLLAAQDDDDSAPHANDLLEEPGFPVAAIVAAAAETLAHYVADPTEALELYDAFTLYYDERQADTTFNAHRDPSHVTVNLCLHSACEGSAVRFFGTADAPGDSFLVDMVPGVAAVHFGRHLHQTTPLVAGSRAQAVLYFKRRGVVGDDDATYGGYVD